MGRTSHLSFTSVFCRSWRPFYLLSAKIMVNWGQDCKNYWTEYVNKCPSIYHNLTLIVAWFLINSNSRKYTESNTSLHARVKTVTLSIENEWIFLKVHTKHHWPVTALGNGCADGTRCVIFSACPGRSLCSWERLLGHNHSSWYIKPGVYLLLYDRVPRNPTLSSRLTCTRHSAEKHVSRNNSSSVTI